MRLLLFYLFLIFLGKTASSQNNYIDSLLNVLVSFQVTHSDSNYHVGMFPSQRIYLSKRKRIYEDDNVFFTGLIVWTLKSIRENLSVKNKAIVDSISAKAINNYYRYQNKDGKPVYNFWQTNPSRHFPNSSYFSSKKKYIIPDDLDDTSIIYLSVGLPDSLKLLLKKLISENANGQKRSIKNTFRKYKYFSAYSTWFGKSMPVDFDICVHANGLRLVLDNDFKIDKFDSATINLVRQMVVSGTYVKRPAYVSPHYQKPAIIMYHLARLVAAYPQQKDIATLKPILISDIKKQITWCKGMDRLLLQTSLARLGEAGNERISVSEKDMEQYYFFVANMTSTFPNPIKGIFADCKKTNFYYRSFPYYITLLLENELLHISK